MIVREVIADLCDDRPSVSSSVRRSVGQAVRQVVGPSAYTNPLLVRKTRLYMDDRLFHVRVHVDISLL